LFRWLRTAANVLTGDIVTGALSSITATLQNGTAFTGAIDAAATAKSVSLALDATSSWHG
jgi:uncharacterized protein (DUF2237 family)